MLWVSSRPIANELCITQAVKMRQPSAFAHLGMRTYASTSASTMTSLYLCSFIDLGVKRWVIISMMLTCDSSVLVCMIEEDQGFVMQQSKGNIAL